MNIVFFWTGITGYMAACWRDLSARPGVNLKLFLEVNREEVALCKELLDGLDYVLCFPGDNRHKEIIDAGIADCKPDLFVVLGWRSKLSRAAALGRKFRGVPKVFAFDMTFAFTLRKLLAPLVLRHYLSHFKGVIVPSERTAFYARFLGFSGSVTERFLIGIDVKKLRTAFDERKAKGSFPKSFVFVGRYSKEKRVDILVEAYQLYRAKVSDPWPLNCYGRGANSHLLVGVEGVSDHGYISPATITDVYVKAGAMVIASEYDPWPLVIAEAVASGLPVVCTDACGSHVDFVRSYYNGVVCGTNDAASIAQGMLWIHENYDNLLEIGRRGMALVEPYSKEQWTEHFLAIAKKYV